VTNANKIIENQRQTIHMMRRELGEVREELKKNYQALKFIHEWIENHIFLLPAQVDKAWEYTMEVGPEYSRDRGVCLEVLKRLGVTPAAEGIDRMWEHEQIKPAAPPKPVIIQ